MKKNTKKRLISIKDRLPDYGEIIFIKPTGKDHWLKVKVVLSDGCTANGTCCSDNKPKMYFEVIDASNMYFNVDEVENWMPLPEPPKGE